MYFTPNSNSRISKNISVLELITLAFFFLTNKLIFGQRGGPEGLEDLCFHTLGNFLPLLLLHPPLTEISALRPKTRPQGPNLSLVAQIQVSRLKLSLEAQIPASRSNLSLEAQILASRPKLQPRGPNRSLEAQIAASMPKSQP